jgi:D-sedoheptulose 7-phosphate isomerase
MQHMPTDTATRGLITSALGEARIALDHLLANEEAMVAIEHAATLLVHTFENGGRVYACGNGGSMSDAMHFAEELTGRFRSNRRGLPAQAISDVGHLSCVANDFGYDQVFSRYVQSHGRAGDCLFAISTSGKSTNVINAAVEAKNLGMTVVALTGRAETQLGALADVCIATPAGEFADRAQELHIKVIHILIELVERKIFPENYGANSQSPLAGC